MLASFIYFIWNRLEYKYLPQKYSFPQDLTKRYLSKNQARTPIIRSRSTPLDNEYESDREDDEVHEVNANELGVERVNLMNLMMISSKRKPQRLFKPDYKQLF
jgi:hypothetical protein